MAKGHGSFIRKHDKLRVSRIEACLYCGNNSNLHIDHILPPKIGGNSEIKNLTRACQKCNSMKSDLPINVFYDRTIGKRNQAEEKLRSYLFRLSNSRKRRGESEEKLQVWLIDKIQALKKDHTYFTKIISSIVRNQYIAFPNG